MIKRLVLSDKDRRKKVRHVLKYFVEREVSITKACERYNLSRHTFNKWVRTDKYVGKKYDEAKYEVSEKHKERMDTANKELLQKKLEGFKVTERKQSGKMTKKEGKDVLDVDKIEVNEKTIYASDNLQWNLLKTLNPEQFKEEQTINVNDTGKVPILVIPKPDEIAEIEEAEIESEKEED